MGFFERRAWKKMDQIIKLGWPDAETSILPSEYAPMGSMLRVRFVQDGVADLFVLGNNHWNMAFAELRDGVLQPVFERLRFPLEATLMAEQIDVAAEFVGNVWDFRSQLAEEGAGEGAS